MAMNFSHKAAFLGMAISLLVMTVGWTAYKYRDCKKVGHSTLYCVVDVGN